MKTENKIINTSDSFNSEIDSDNEDQIHNELNYAIEEQRRVKRLIDLFVLGLFMVFILYTYLSDFYNSFS